MQYAKLSGTSHRAADNATISKVTPYEFVRVLDRAFPDAQNELIAKSLNHLYRGPQTVYTAKGLATKADCDPEHARQILAFLSGYPLGLLEQRFTFLEGAETFHVTAEQLSQAWEDGFLEHPHPLKSEECSDFASRILVRFVSTPELDKFYSNSAVT